MGEFPVGFVGEEFPHGGITHRVFRGDGDGPAVILIHEAAGLNGNVVALAKRLQDAGLRPVMPVLLGEPSETTGFGQVLRNMRCIARDFGGFATNTSTPIVDWLRALARSEQTRSGGRRVGVVGMCFSGGFALAMVMDDAVAAAVASEPAVPFAIPLRRRELGMSASELEEVARRADDGFCVRALRYQRDFKSPGVRMRFIAEMLPNVSVVEIPTWNPNRHSVLTDAVVAPSPDLTKALEGTIEYLRRALIVRKAPA